VHKPISKAIHIVAPGSEWHGDYDIDGWRLEELPDRGHVIHLRLGRWVQIFALAMVDVVGKWRLMLMDSPADWVDEPEILINEVTFSCEVELPVPENAIVTIDGVASRVTAATLTVQAKPSSFELGLVLADPPRALVLDNVNGWRLVDQRGNVISREPKFSVAIDTRA
jgi:hypothetical protein